MKKKMILCMAVVLACMSLAACKGEKKGKIRLQVLAAASMTDAMEEIGNLYGKAHPDTEILYSFDSSGTLKTQIAEGAPADVFVSAAMRQMEELASEEFVEPDSVVKLLENKVVLIQPTGGQLPVFSFQEVSKDAVSMIAIGNADVPVGQYTEEIYTNLGLWEEIQSKANFATNVRQVLDWVATKNVDCGIVYATDAMIEKNVEVICEADETMCEPVIYPAGIVKATKHPKEAEMFLKFLQTEEAQNIFEKYGFRFMKNN